MKKKSRVIALGAVLLSSAIASWAADDMKLANRILFRSPELAKPGACVMYREGGAGWILTEPVYWLKGTTVASEVRKRRQDICPDVPGKLIEQYSREEFNRLALAHPCVAKAENVREEEFGLIRLRIDSWETPWSKRAANAGRLFQGSYLDRKLVKDAEIEIPADFLMACD